MKILRVIFIILVILMLGLAFVPVLAFPTAVDVSWQRFADAYQGPFYIYLPTIMR